MLWFGKVKKLNRENQMKTIEIFAEAVKFASEASDIPSDRILSESRAESVRLTLNALSVVSAYPRTTSRIRNKSATIRRRTMSDKMHNVNTF